MILKCLTKNKYKFKYTHTHIETLSHHSPLYKGKKKVIKNKLNMIPPNLHFIS